MGIEYTLLILVVLLAIALALAPVAARAKLSLNVVLMATGYIGSELIVGQGIDTGIRWHMFHGLIFFVLLPILIFEGGLNLNTRLLRENIGAVLLLSMPLLGVSAAIIAISLHYAAPAGTGMPLLLALLTATLLATTDTSGIPATLRESPALARLNVLIEGESAFNDAISVVLFSVLLALAMGGMAPDAGAAAGRFFAVLFGGVATGLVFGAGGVYVLRRLRQFALKSIVTLLLIYGSYITAEALLDVSGVMALLVVGIMVGWLVRQQPDAPDNAFLRQLWEYKAFLANAVTFLLLGITITGGMFVEHWRLMLVGIVGVAIARGLSILLGVSLLSVIPGSNAVPWRDRPLLGIGGVPGTVSVALALSLPLALDGWYAVQSTVYGVVIFYLVLQTPAISLLLRARRGAAIAGGSPGESGGSR